MNNIELFLRKKYSLQDTISLVKYLKENFSAIDFTSLSQATSSTVFQAQSFVTSFIKANLQPQHTLTSDEKEDLFLYISCLLKFKLFTFPETVEFFVARSFQSFLPQSLRQAFYNFKKSKKMSQLQVFLNYNFIDLQQLYQIDPEQQKIRFEQFYSHWIQYLAGNKTIIQQVNPEVYQILSGEIQVSIPTAIQQLQEDQKIQKNYKVIELETKINSILAKQLKLDSSSPLPPPQSKYQNKLSFPLPSEEIPLAQTPSVFNLNTTPVPQNSKIQISQLFQIANSFPNTIPAPPQISLQNFTKNQFSILTDQMQSLSLLNQSMSNSILSHDFKMVISEPQQGGNLGKRVIQEDSDAGQNLVQALGGLDEVSMCLMQLGLQERSESRI